MNLHLHKKMKQSFVQAFGMILVATTMAYGQKQTNTVFLTGTVYDQIGVVCPYAKVIATNQEGIAFETVTDEGGGFKLSLPGNVYKPGGDFRKRISTYSAKVLLTGFKVTEIHGMKLVPTRSGFLRLDAVLEVGILGEN